MLTDIILFMFRMVFLALVIFLFLPLLFLLILPFMIISFFINTLVIIAKTYFHKTEIKSMPLKAIICYYDFCIKKLYSIIKGVFHKYCFLKEIEIYNMN